MYALTLQKSVINKWMSTLLLRFVISKYLVIYDLGGTNYDFLITPNRTS